MFSMDTTEGSYSLPRKGWLMLFYYEGDFLPVSASELMALAELQEEFFHQNCAILAAAPDSVAVHLAFLENLHRHCPLPIRFPLGTAHGPKGITLLHNGQPQAQFFYSPRVGVNFTEALRTLMALQTQRPTPCGWVPESCTLALPPTTRAEMEHYIQRHETEGKICTDWYLCYENFS